MNIQQVKEFFQDEEQIQQLCFDRIEAMINNK